MDRFGDRFGDRKAKAGRPLTSRETVFRKRLDTVKTLMKQRGLTQDNLYDKLKGVHSIAYSSFKEVMRGRRVPLADEEFLRRIALVFAQMDNGNSTYISEREQYYVSIMLFPSRTSHLRVEDVTFVQQHGLPRDELIRQLRSLDFELIEDLTDDNEASIEVLVPVFFEYPETWRLIVDTQHCIVGYWHFVPLVSEQIQRVRVGVFIDREITIGNLTYFGLPGEYDIYIAFLGILPRHRMAGNGLLLYSFLDQVRKLANNSIYVRSVLANALTPSAINLCHDLNMTRVGNHRSNGVIFESRMQCILEGLENRHGRMLAGYRNLVERYQIQGKQ